MADRVTDGRSERKETISHGGGEVSRSYPSMPWWGHAASRLK
jgi:hypothetical protein